MPIIGAALLSAAATWLFGYVINSPQNAAASVASVRDSVTKVEGRLATLCNDYGQTVSRLDQNLQILGQALKAPVVVGKSNTDPCK